MKYFVVFNFFILLLFGMSKGTVIGSKTVGTDTLSLVKVEAMVLPNKITETESDGTSSLFFLKLDGETGLSKQTFIKVPHVKNDKVTIYYIEKKNDKYKHQYHVFFDVNKVSFYENSHPKNPSDSTFSISENTEIGKGKHAIRDLFEGGGIYLVLFMLFLTLNGFLNDSIIETMIHPYINRILQLFLISLFLFGGEYIIRTEQSSCYDNPYMTKGTIDYFIDEPMVKFIDCYGHKSQSERKNPEWLGMAKGERAQIYYSHDTRDYYSNKDVNIYRVYSSETAYEEEREKPLRFYFGLLMLFIFIYTYKEKGKKLSIPSSVVSHEVEIYVYPRERKYFAELLNILDKEYYSLGTWEEYLLDPSVKTNDKNQILIKRFNLFNILLPSAVAFGLWWVFLRVASGLFGDMTNSSEKIIIFFIFIFASIFTWIAFKNVTAQKKVGLFNGFTKLYTSFDDEKNIYFKDIYAYTITYKSVLDDDKDFRTELYELDMVLKSGKVVNLYARKGNNDTQILEEAKIIATYSEKPIFHFGKKDINKIFSLDESMAL